MPPTPNELQHKSETFFFWLKLKLQQQNFAKKKQRTLNQLEKISYGSHFVVFNSRHANTYKTQHVKTCTFLDNYTFMYKHKLFQVSCFLIFLHLFVNFILFFRRKISIIKVGKMRKMLLAHMNSGSLWRKRKKQTENVWNKK